MRSIMGDKQDTLDTRLRNALDELRTRTYLDEATQSILENFSSLASTDREDDAGQSSLNTKALQTCGSELNEVHGQPHKIQSASSIMGLPKHRLRRGETTNSLKWKTRSESVRTIPGGLPTLGKKR